MLAPPSQQIMLVSVMIILAGLVHPTLRAPFFPLQDSK